VIYICIKRRVCEKDKLHLRTAYIIYSCPCIRNGARVKTVPSPATAGPVNLLLNIAPQVPCDELMLTFEKADHMAYQGPDTLMAPAEQGKPAEFSLEVEIAANDTCGLVFKISGGTGDTVRFYPGNPRLGLIHKYDPDSLDLPIRRVTPDSTRDAEGRLIRSFYDKDGNPVPRPEKFKIKKQPVKEYYPAADEFVPVEKAPEMIYQETPEYPKGAEKACKEGVTWVKALVDQEGNVKDVELSKTSGMPEFDDAALKAAYKCRFKPAVQNGYPVSCWVTYKVKFSLTEK